jgi:NADPH-dependent 2,4-dienoyl-CoA reductase/sulfur reductase-like enzyme
VGDLVIVGGGLASARAIKAYREAGGDDEITLVSGDRRIPYHRPPLSKRFLRGEAEVEDTLVEQQSFYDANAVVVRLQTVVASLDLEGRRLALEDEDELRFDRLLIASGASPRRLPVAGGDREDVLSLRTLDDSARIRERAGSAERAVVVGAGFIGMEVAASLTQLGVHVTLVHRGTQLFEVLRAPVVSDYLRELYEAKGVELVLGDEVSEFGGNGRLHVSTKGGRAFDADLAVVGIGVQPNTGWLEGSGLAIDNGVVVNERYETGADDVWAVADVARFYDPVFRKHRRIEHWSNANFQGTQVGEVMAGGDARYDIVSTFFSEVFGVTFKVFGDVDEFDELVFRGSLESGNAIGFYLREGRLVACVLTGQDEETEARLKELIGDGARARDNGAVADAGVPLDDAFTPADA